jgi:transposase
MRLPAYSPELNLLEECRRRVKRDLSTRFFGSLEELTTAVDGALDQLSGPDVNKYL